MTKGQIIGSVLSALGFSGVVYFGFLRKDALGNTMWDNLLKKKNDDIASKRTATDNGKTKTPTIPSKHTDPHTTAPEVTPTPEAKATSKSIDEYKGQWLIAPADGVKLYNSGLNVLKTYKKGESIGRVGDNLKNGYHHVYDGGYSEGRIYDGWIKMALKI